MNISNGIACCAKGQVSRRRNEGWILKKKIIVLFIVALISSLFFISTLEKATFSTFRATIVEIYGDTAIVDNATTGEIIKVDLSVNPSVTFQVGDEIEVGFSGGIRESYPAQINTISVELVE